MATSGIHVHALSIGKEQTFVADDGRSMTTAIRKVPQTGPVRLTFEGFEGDETSHPAHGGPSMRVHAFRWEHYDYFSRRAGRPVPVPVFGENLTLSGYGETEARAGDVVRVGGAVLRVTQPTERCGTIGRSAGLADMLDWIEESLHTGFYLSVMEEGEVAAGDALELLERGREDLSIDALNRLMFQDLGNAARIAELSNEPTISPEWRASLQRRVQRLKGDA